MTQPISYNSEFLPEITIAVVFSDNPQYEKLEPMFNEYGYGFMVPNKNLVIIDGEQIINNFDADVLKFIEAHEIAHIILNHDGPRNEEEELFSYINFQKTREFILSGLIFFVYL